MAILRKLPPPLSVSIGGTDYHNSSASTAVPAGSGLTPLAGVSDGGNDYHNNASSLVVTPPTNELTPKIQMVQPPSGAPGTKVTIIGEGFTSTGNKIKFGDLGSENNPSYVLNSDTGKMLVFVVPSSNYLSCWFEKIRCLAPIQLIQPGVYSISVINAYGTSNTVQFTVVNSPIRIDNMVQ